MWEGRWISEADKSRLSYHVFMEYVEILDFIFLWIHYQDHGRVLLCFFLFLLLRQSFLEPRLA